MFHFLNANLQICRSINDLYIFCWMNDVSFPGKECLNVTMYLQAKLVNTQKMDDKLSLLWAIFCQEKFVPITSKVLFPVKKRIFCVEGNG